MDTDSETSMRSGMKRKRIKVTPGSEWTDSELDFFKIRIQPEKNSESFFDGSLVDPEALFPWIREIQEVKLSDPRILRTIDWSCFNGQASRIVKYILSATRTHTTMESAVDDLSKTLLEAFGYDDGDLIIHSQEELQLEMCGRKTSAKPDLSIATSHLTIRLLVQEDKSYRVSMSADPEAQVIAEAIAAFQMNTKTRQKNDLEPEEFQLIPCITMMGTYPTLYLFRMTRELGEAVRKGEEPVNETYVKRYRIHTDAIPSSDAMLEDHTRLEIFKCYATFKKFVISAPRPV